MLEKDAIYSKIDIIKNCLNTITHLQKNPKLYSEEIVTSSLYILNLQRACQACIDIANLIISIKGFELPTQYKQAFSILEKNEVISPDVSKVMQSMVGFRNIAIHDYKKIDPKILKSILDNHLKDFEAFYTATYNYIQKVKL